MLSSSPDPNVTQHPQQRRFVTMLCWVMLAAVLCGGCGFVYKLIQFVHEALGSETESFAAVPVTVYVLVALGFVSLFIWGLARGQFTDIEGPKYRLLEEDERHERAGI